MLLNTENHATTTHPWVPERDHNGNAFSPEQKRILHYVVEALSSPDPEHRFGLCIEAVAGSGKTTVIRAMFHVLAAAHADGVAMSVTATAFNRSMAGVATREMKATKPADADWATTGGGTLNAHGWRTVRQAFDHQIDLVDDRVKFSALLARIVVADAMGDARIRGDFVENCPVTAAGNKRLAVSIQSLARKVGELAVKAMSYGFWIPGHDLDWNRFIRLNRGNLRLDDWPCASRGPIFLALHDWCERIATLSVEMVATPGLRVETRADAAWWLKSREPYCTGVLTIVNGMTDAERIDAGLLHVPTAASTKAAGVPGSIRRYRVEGRFAHDRILVDLGHLSGADFAALKTAMWDRRHEMGKMGHVNVQQGAKWSDVLPRDHTGWGRTIKDTPEVIAAFCSIVRDATQGRCDPSPLFTTNESIEDAQTVAKGLAGFIDQVYAPVRLGLAPWRTFDLVIADEVQDMSALQGTLLRSLMAENGSAVIVGDRRQSLYLFNGASSQSMTTNAEAMRCDSLPMTVCFRQSARLAAEVSRLLGRLDDDRLLYADHRHPDYIEGWATGTDADVRTIGMEALLGAVETGDMVLCRMGAPLVAPALSLLASGTPVVIAGGKDLPASIRRLYRDLDEGHNLGDRITAYLEALLHGRKGRKGLRGMRGLVRSPAYRGDEAAARQDESYVTAEMLGDALRSLNTAHRESESSLPLVATQGTNDYIGSLFDTNDDEPAQQNENVVTFSTVHRAKGLEASRVFIITDRMGEDDEGNPKASPCFMLPWSMHTPDEAEQERNAVYVALTRAMDEMVYVTVNGHDAWWMLDTGDVPYGPSIQTDDEPEDEPEDEDADLPGFICDLCGDVAYGTIGGVVSICETCDTNHGNAHGDAEPFTDEDAPESDSEAVEAPEGTDDTPEPVDAPETPSEGDSDLPREFAVVVRVDGDHTVDMITADPVEAQKRLAELALFDVPSPYAGGQWLERDPIGHVAVWARWLPIDDEAVDAAIVEHMLPLVDAYAEAVQAVEHEAQDDEVVLPRHPGAEVMLERLEGLDVERLAEVAEEALKAQIARQEQPPLPPVLPRQRMSQDERMTSILETADALAAVVRATGATSPMVGGMSGAMVGTSDDTIALPIDLVAHYAGCSVDTIKRVLDEAARTCPGSKAHVTRSKSFPTPDDAPGTGWVSMWLRMSLLHDEAENDWEVACSRGPSGRYRRSEPIQFITKHGAFGVDEEAIIEAILNAPHEEPDIVEESMVEEIERDAWLAGEDHDDHGDRTAFSLIAEAVMNEVMDDEPQPGIMERLFTEQEPKAPCRDTGVILRSTEDALKAIEKVEFLLGVIAGPMDIQGESVRRIRYALVELAGRCGHIFGDFTPRGGEEQ